MANVDIGWLNDVILSIMQGVMSTSYSVDSSADSEHSTVFEPQYWNTTDEPSLSPQIFRLEVSMPVMVRRDLNAPRPYNGTRIQLTRAE